MSCQGKSDWATFFFFFFCLFLCVPYKPLNKRHRLKNTEPLIQWFLCYSKQINETWKNTQGYLRVKVQSSTIFICLVKCLFVKILMNLIFFCIILDPVTWAALRYRVLPLFGLFCKTTKWGDASQQIRVNTWTSSYATLETELIANIKIINRG